MTGTRAFDLCAICELPRFCHDWRIFRRRTSRLSFVNPFPGSPRLSGLRDLHLNPFS